MSPNTKINYTWLTFLNVQKKRNNEVLKIHEKLSEFSIEEALLNIQAKA